MHEKLRRRAIAFSIAGVIFGGLNLICLGFNPGLLISTWVCTIAAWIFLWASFRMSAITKSQGMKEITIWDVRREIHILQTSLAKEPCSQKIYVISKKRLFVLRVIDFIRFSYRFDDSFEDWTTEIN